MQDPDKRVSVVDTAFIRACGNLTERDRISALLEHSLNVDINCHHSTVMSYALTNWGGSTMLIDLLIQRGADVNNYDEPSPFQQAIDHEDEETIHMLLCYGVDVRPFFVLSCPNDSVVIARELMYPFVDMCDMEVLSYTDFNTLHDMWPYQDKEVFARWCLKYEPHHLMRTVFSTDHKNCFGIEVFSRFLHMWFNECLMYEIMYYPVTSAAILNLLPQFDSCYLDDSDMADVLRILLSNTNVLHQFVFKYLHESFRNPAGIVKVLEDLNVRVVKDDRNQSGKETLLWRMYTSNTFKVQDIDKFEVVDELVLLSQFYHFNSHNVIKTPFIFPGVGCSLVELCRNKIREMCIVGVDNEHEYRPFDYARRIKSLPIPQHLKEVVLLRRPLYPPTTLYKDRPPNYSARW